MESRAAAGTGRYLMVWGTLIVLTGATVTAAGLHLARWSALAAIVIATVKGSLVLLDFMHMREESAIFRWALLLALVTLGIIMALTFTDIAFRPR